MYDKSMVKITIKELIKLSLSWTVTISRFYADFRDKSDDVSFRKLLTTMIDKEGEYTEYCRENLKKLNLEIDFIAGNSKNIVFDDIFEEMPNVEGMSKISFLKKAVHFQNISIKICDLLRESAKTDRGKLVFKELAEEEKRHMFIFKDHLELEELF